MVRMSLVLAVLALVLIPAAAAQAKPTRCASADLRYPFEEGGPNTFGVFKLRVTHGSCTTAHRVAKKWMTRFERNLRAGKVKLPKNVEGFAFKTLKADQAQSYNERGRKDGTTIRFEYVVPNG
jgi:hypothetical protein